MGEAFRFAREEMAVENDRIRMLRDRLWAGFSDMEEVYVNGDLERRIPHNLNVSFNFVEGESLIMAVEDLAGPSGSACSPPSLEPPYLLPALRRLPRPPPLSGAPAHRAFHTAPAPAF